jgi:hypothetical protein
LLDPSAARARATLAGLSSDEKHRLYHAAIKAEDNFASVRRVMNKMGFPNIEASRQFRQDHGPWLKNNQKGTMSVPPGMLVKFRRLVPSALIAKTSCTKTFNPTTEELEVSGLGHGYDCLKLFEASSYGSMCENQEHRRAELNVGLHRPTARIEFLAATTSRKLRAKRKYNQTR